MGKLRAKISLVTIFALIISGCAKEMSPLGGPKDQTPPKALKAKPENRSTNFKAKKISITFDEFIDLKNVQKVTISPPLTQKHQITLRGKTIIIQLNDTLRHNTTYNINFYDVIRDYSEGNIADNFQYIFSTGSEIDTMSIIGQVVHAKTGQAAANIQVGLYTTFYDSVVSTKKPLYYSKTSKDGKFTINNIKNSEYLIFALEDIGNDMLFKLPNEKIAFNLEPIRPNHNKNLPIKTNNDSLKPKENTTNNNQQTEPLKLYLFEHDNQKQYVKKQTRLSRNTINIVLNREPYSHTTLTTIDNIDFYPRYSQRSDSLLFIIPTLTIANNENIKAVIKYTTIDSLEKIVTIADTINLEKAKEQIYAVDTTIDISTNTQNNKLDKDKKLKLYFNHPVGNINYNKIGLYKIDDSVKTKIDFNATLDSTKTVAEIDFYGNEDTNYEMEIDTLAVIDIFQHKSQPKVFKFKIPAESEHGVLALNINGVLTAETMIELIDKSNNVPTLTIRPELNNINLKNLKPGTYTLRLFIDSNKNRKWDTGNYYKKVEPEKVITYDRDITIRANWDTEVTWNL